MSYMDEEETHSFGECEAVVETDKAIGVKRADSSTDDPFDDEPFWIPKSVVHDDSEVSEKGDTGDLVVKRWWAVKNGHT